MYLYKKITMKSLAIASWGSEQEGVWGEMTEAI
jgi:hypothetical protein